MKGLLFFSETIGERLLAPSLVALALQDEGHALGGLGGAGVPQV